MSDKANTQATSKTYEFHLTDSAINRIHVLLSQELHPSYFRVAVNGGGCSGFQYEFLVVPVEKHCPDKDILIACGDYWVVIDTISMAFLEKSSLDYKVTLMESSFVVKNPNAKSSCGCGVSFSL